MASPTPLEEIPHIVSSLRKTFNTGKTKSKEWRVHQLKQLLKMLKENEKLFQKALRDDLHMDAFLLGFEVTGCEPDINSAIDSLDKWTSHISTSIPVAVFPATALLVPEPLGVVLLISPWNYPLSLISRPLIGVLAAGNCVVIKPSEISENTTKIFSELLPRYMDVEAIRVVNGAAEETTILLREKFDKICYTGSTAVGKIVMRAAAEHLTPVLLELGGKSPLIIDKNIDLAKAVPRLVWGKFMNAGQTCIAPDYALVHEDVVDQFVNEVKKVIEKFWGKDPKTSFDYGRIINHRHMNRLKGLIHSNPVHYGGIIDDSERYISPTLILQPDISSLVMKEEIFGPILPIISIPSLSHAISFINERPKPLALYIFTSSSTEADNIINNTSSGAVCVNETVFHNICKELPFGGVGESGMGGYNGKYSFNEFAHVKGVLKRGIFSDPEVRFPPYDNNKITNLKRLQKIEAMLKYVKHVGMAIVVVVVSVVVYKYVY